MTEFSYSFASEFTPRVLSQPSKQKQSSLQVGLLTILPNFSTNAHEKCIWNIITNWLKYIRKLLFSKIFKKCYIELLCICTTIPETENLFIIDLICPNTDPDNFFSRKIIWPRENDQLIPDQIWSEFVDKGDPRT